MPFDSKIHHRRSIRLPGYDYSQSGAYYVTLVTHTRECLFGQVINAEMQLNQFGQIVQRAWLDLPNHYPHVELGAFCIMPNHVHAVIILYDGRGGSIGDVPLSDVPHSGNAPLQDGKQTRLYVGKMPLQIMGDPPLHRISGESRSYVRHPLSEIVRAFKSFSARRINAIRKTPGVSVWQRNYYEHIIRNNADHNRIDGYIQSNIDNWATDDENRI